MNNFKLVVIFIILNIGCSIKAQNISQWRGPNRDGIFENEQLLKTWPDKGPDLLWFNDNVGDGYGSPSVNSGVLFINGGIDSISYLFAFDLKGKLLWKSPNGKEFVGNGYGSQFPGSRSTPTVYDDLVYTCSGLGRIACFEKQTGKEKWAVDMDKDLNGFMNYFGYSESVLVDKDNVYCIPGGGLNFAIALNRFTGQKVWTSKAFNDTIAYCSPMLVNLPAKKLMVTFTCHYILGFDAGNGDLLWTQKQENVKYKQQCNTPVYSNGYLYYVAGDGNGAVKLNISEDGKSIKELWSNPLIKNNFSGFVKINDYLYSTDQSQKLKCIDINTGQTIDSISINKGAIISANGLLYCYSQNGEVNLIKPHESNMAIISKFKIDKGTKEHFAHPVISNGILFIRHGRTLLAYNIKG
jgi:outer membrane protein assembly factor BamB